MRRTRAISNRFRGWGAASAPAPFNPSSIPGFVAAFDPTASLASNKLWQDASKTTLATAHNDPVRVGVCPWSRLDWTAPSDAARGLLQTDGIGHWWILTDGVDDLYAGPDLTSLVTSAATVFVAARVNSGSQYTIYSTLDSTGGSWHFDAVSGNSHVSALRSSRVNAQPIIPSGSNVEILYRSSGSSYKRDLNGTTDIDTTAAFACGTKWTLGTAFVDGAYSGSTQMAGRIYGLFAFSRILDAAEIDQMRTYISGLLP